MAEDQRMLEERHLEQVERVIEENLARLYEERTELREQVLAARKEMWDEAPSLVRDFDDVVQLALQDSQVGAAEKSLEQNEREIDRQEKMRRSPFFGRLDYEEAGQARTVYIGIYGLRGQGSRRTLVADWRAPVSSMFYSFDIGPGWFDAPNGRRNVDIVLKRQYKIEDGRLALMYDTDSSMYDGILGQVLSQGTDPALRVIVGSIQKEQNAAIRSDIRNSCLIYGLAGSGKTSVGLHRLAYILYHDRERVKAENILVISNNAIFSSYISTILPDLGEAPAESLVFHDLLPEALGQGCEIEEYYHQLAAVESGENPWREEWLGVKYDPAFLEYCQKYFADFPYRIPEVRYGGQVILSEEAFQAKWKNMRFSAFRPGYELLRQLVRETIDNYFRDHQEEICRDIEKGSQVYLSEKEVRALCQKTRREYVDGALAEICRLNRLEPEAQAVEVLRRYLEEAGGEAAAAAALSRALKQRKLWYEDGLLCLFVRILMGEVPARPNILHIVIDEAQDYNPLQLFIIKLLYPKGRFTILADAFQAVGGPAADYGYGLFDRVFGPGLRKVRLEKCYRSSAEINGLAFQLLSRECPDIAGEYSWFERHAQKPLYLISPSPAQALPALMDRFAHSDSLAVITADEEQARQVKARLGDRVKLMVSPEDQLTGGPVVLPLLLAKGLEFDSVILFCLVSSTKENPRFRRRLYLGCTRALHELCLLEPEEAPAGMEDCLPCLKVKRETESGDPEGKA